MCNIFNAHAIFLVKNPGRIIQHSLYICQAVWFNPHTVIQYADPQIRFMCITDNLNLSALRKICQAMDNRIFNQRLQRKFQYFLL